MWFFFWCSLLQVGVACSSQGAFGRWGRCLWLQERELLLRPGESTYFWGKDVPQQLIMICIHKTSNALCKPKKTGKGNESSSQFSDEEEMLLKSWKWLSTERWDIRWIREPQKTEKERSRCLFLGSVWECNFSPKRNSANSSKTKNQIAFIITDICTHWVCVCWWLLAGQNFIKVDAKRSIQKTDRFVT